MNGRLDFNNQKDVDKISKRIRFSYRKHKGTNHGDEECVQEILTRMLEGRHQHATIDQAVIDYLRSNHGDARLPSHSERQKLEHAITSGSEELESNIGFVDGRELFNRSDIDDYGRWIGNQIDRATMMLTYKWGLNEIEIGHLFGFSESRVSQRLKRIQKCLYARITASESRALSGQMATVLRSETERNLWGVGKITFERMETGQSFRMESFNETSF